MFFERIKNAIPNSIPSPALKVNITKLYANEEANERGTFMSSREVGIKLTKEVDNWYTYNQPISNFSYVTRIVLE